MRPDPPLLEATVGAAIWLTGSSGSAWTSVCRAPVPMTIADGGGILERLTQMVDLTSDEIPMPQERLDLLPGCSGKTYSDCLQARDDELGNGVA